MHAPCSWATDEFFQHRKRRQFLQGLRFSQQRIASEQRRQHIFARKQMKSRREDRSFQNRVTSTIESKKRSAFASMNNRGWHSTACFGRVDMVDSKLKPATAIFQDITINDRCSHNIGIGFQAADCSLRNHIDLIHNMEDTATRQSIDY
jgi:hypothetical protein